MEFFHKKTAFDFMRHKAIFIIISLVLFATSIYAWIERGEGKYGVDFAGGSELLVQFDKETRIGEVRSGLTKGGLDNAVVQSFPQGENEFSIRLKSSEESNISAKVEKILVESLTGRTVKILKDDFVGPTIGAEIARNGLIALTLAILGIMVYVSFRFEFRYAIGAIVALLHDVTISAGLFLLAGGEMNATIIAALLAILGFSVNDTIVIFDRIRENLAKAQRKSGASRNVDKRDELSGLINLSVNETLSRTIITSATVFFCAICLLLYGGGALWELSFTLTVGILVGTYSTIFIASPIILMFERRGKSA